MHAPKTLKKTAKAFWDTHAKVLQKRGILSENSLNSFTILCQTWGMLQAVIEKLENLDPEAENYREMAQRHALTKDYMHLAKQFGLLPADARRSKMEEAGDDVAPDEFGV